MTSRTRRALVGLGIGLALADSSVVTLALPDILRQFDVEIPQVAWVLTSYNLGLALAAVPAAYAARRRPVPAFVAGTLVFAAASLACALAPSFGVLVGARCVQAVGGALLVCAALDLLTEIEGNDAARGPHLGVGRGARRCARAGHRRDPHRDPGLGVDLPRPGAARPRDAPRRPPAPGAAARGAGGSSERSCEPRAAARLRRADRRAVPARAAARRRLAHRPGRRGADRDGDAGRGDRDRGVRAADRQHGHACRGGGDPDHRRAGRPRRAPRLGLVVDAPAPGARRRRARARALGAHRAGAARTVAAGRARRLDDRRAPRGRRRSGCSC